MAAVPWLHRSMVVTLVFLMISGSVRGTELQDYGILERTASVCFNQTTKTLTLVCEVGQWVKVTHVFQGHSETGSCGYVEGDCTVNVTDVSFPCIGRQSCDINLPSGGAGTYIHWCDKHSTYMQITYSCVPEPLIEDVCAPSAPVIYRQWGYIASPRFPNNYPDNQDCVLTIQSGFPDQRISLFAIDLRLETNGTGCSDWLQVHDRFHSKTTCSSGARVQIFRSDTNFVQVTFHSNGNNREKGFWIYYEASPYHVTTTTWPTPPGGAGVPPWSPGTARDPPTTTTTTTVTPQAGATTASPGTGTTHFMYSVDSTFPIGLLVGVMLGALFCIMIVLIVMLVIRRRRAKSQLSRSASSSVGMLEPRQASREPASKADYLVDSVEAPPNQWAVAQPLPAKCTCTPEKVKDAEAMWDYRDTALAALDPNIFVKGAVKVEPVKTLGWLAAGDQNQGQAASQPKDSGTKPKNCGRLPGPQTGVCSASPSHGPQGPGDLDLGVRQVMSEEDRAAYIDLNLDTGEERLYC